MIGLPRLIRTIDLDLSENILGDDGARIIARSPQLASLRVLRLGNCGIGDEARGHSPRAPTCADS